MFIAIGINILGCVILGICADKARRKNGKLAKSVWIYEMVACVCSIIFTMYIYTSSPQMAVIFRSLLMAGADWLLLFLMVFTQHYTEQFKEVRFIRNLVIAYASLDTLFMLLNIWSKQIFYVEITADAQKQIYYGNWQYVRMMHSIYTVGIIAIMLLTYCVVILKTSRFYRIRYTMIGLAFLLDGIASIFAVRIRGEYNLSFVFFSITSVVIYYFSLCYVPNELLQKTFALLIQESNSGIICFDNLGRCIYCNDVVKELCQIGEDLGTIERQYRKWYTGNKEDFVQSSIIYHTAYGGKEGKDRKFEIVVTQLYDEKDVVVGVCFTFYDRTKEQEKLEYEQYRATHDSLTGMLNKEQFYEETYQLLHKYSDESFYILYTNIESFKFVNDIFGIAKGDEILCRQAASMESYGTEKVLCARIQGDHFAMCIPESEFSTERISDAIQKIEEEFTSNVFHLRIYAGVYKVGDIEEPISIMCDKANIAGGTIKNNYQKRIAFYNTVQLIQSLKEKSIIGEFECALNKEEFAMFLQPQVDAKGQIQGAEALVRWIHPEKGVVAPGRFMDTLEKTGLVYKLDKYMWEKAAQKLKEWKQKEIPYYISVNISTKDFFFLDIYETFVQLIEQYEIEPERLKLEITETTLMSDFKENMKILGKLQAYGFQIEIDDFGSGYSSLNMLRNIKANVLKIDRDFLVATENEVRDQDILQSIVVLAEKIGMSVIVEGVETKKQLEMLIGMGCRLFQGYYFSKPLSVEKFEECYIRCEMTPPL